MRTLLLSDVHANIVALEAVLDDAEARDWEAVAFLGDAVGYYTEPNEVIDRLRELAPSVAILGNHDALLLDVLDGRPGDGRAHGMVTHVLRDHAERLTPTSVDFLRSLRDGHCSDGWQAAHGGLDHAWTYLDSIQAAEANLPLLDERLCFVGHTHIPRVYAALEHGGKTLWRTVAFRKDEQRYRMPPRARGFANPGAVGQPRDGIPLASYAIFDAASSTFDIHRVAYDVERVVASVEAAGYPAVLGARLRVGQ